MQKVKFDYQSLNNDVLYNKIFSNPLGKKLIEELNLSKDEVIDNYNLINQYLDNNELCLNCKGKDFCKQSSIGYNYNLRKDANNNIVDYYHICNFYKDYYFKKDNLVISSIKESELLNELNKNFIIDNANLLDDIFLKRIINIKKGLKVPGAYLYLKDSKLRLKFLKSLTYILLDLDKVAIIKLNELIKIIKSEFKSNTSTYQKVLNANILILDGIGNESITSWARDEILFSLIDERISKEKITIIASEYKIEELNKIYKLNYNDEAKVTELIEKIKIIKNGE